MDIPTFPTACIGDGRPERPPEGLTKPSAIHYLDMYANQPDDDSPFVAEDTLKERNRVWNSWIRFCDDYTLKGEDVWITFAQYPEKAEAQAPFRGFLHRYVDDSVQRRPILGPEEYENKRMLDSARSVTEIWRRLVASAEHRVFKPRRREGGPAAAALKLRWDCKEEGEREGPAYRLVKWIFTELAPLLGLQIDPSYEKVEMTSIDVHDFVVTLWTRADAIFAKPQSRMSMHAKLLLAAIGGFRRGMLRGITYSQLQVAALRDPKSQSRVKIVVTIKIRRNKIKETAKIGQKRNGGWISFSITLVPNRAFCLASLILTQAINDQAFEAGYNTVEEIFDKPNLETVDFIPLKWRPDVKDQEVFRLSDSMLAELFHRTLLVMGVRRSPRYYSLRVGCGARLDGVLSNALRNYVLSHTTDVFESSYQSNHVRADLMNLAFGSEAGGSDDLLFAMLRNVSMTKDPGAPIYILPEEENAFKWRKDITGLYDAMRATTDKREKSRLGSKINSLTKTLSRLKLEEKRASYFDEADQLRARGLSTAVLHQGGGPATAHQTGPVKAVSMLLDIRIGQCDAAHKINPRPYIIALLGYLSNAPIAPIGKTEISPPAAVKSILSEVKKKSHCFLCDTPLSCRSSLTKHCDTKHPADTSFGRPFPCPECKRLGLDEAIVDGRQAWSAHTERVHGRANAPNWISQTSSSRYQCSLCPAESSTAAKLLSHMNNHVHSSSVQWPVDCFDCSRSISTQVTLKGVWEWLWHFKAFHDASALFCILCGHICTATSGLTRHMDRYHRIEFEASFACPACKREGIPQPCEIDSIASWHIHLMTNHSEWGYAGTRWAASAPNKSSQEPAQSNDSIFKREGRGIPPPYSYQPEATEGYGCMRFSPGRSPKFLDDVLSAPLIQENTNVNWPPIDLARNQTTWNSHDIYRDKEKQQNSSAALSVSECISSSPGLITATSEPSDFPVSESLYELGDDSKQNPSIDCSRSKEARPSADSLYVCGTQTDSCTPSFPMELVDPALCDGQDLTHPMEDIDETATDLSLALEDPQFMDIDKHHEVDSLLERWNKNLFLLRWKEDRSCWWVQRRDINAHLVQSFEENYTGINLGVDKVLTTRKRRGKIEYRIRWLGRPVNEDTWVLEKQMSPEMVKKHKPTKAATRRRKRY
ncbi:hypothetical protein F5B18DRAFT_643736 [Nemania serpens]|nr:hypothetical protein F5B18DRAFT_643736 [Nemania serpens]